MPYNALCWTSATCVWARSSALESRAGHSQWGMNRHRRRQKQRNWWYRQSVWTRTTTSATGRLGGFLDLLRPIVSRTPGQPKWRMAIAGPPTTIWTLIMRNWTHSHEAALLETAAQTHVQFDRHRNFLRQFRCRHQRNFLSRTLSQAMFLQYDPI